MTTSIILAHILGAGLGWTVGSVLFNKAVASTFDKVVAFLTFIAWIAYIWETYPSLP